MRSFRPRTFDQLAMYLIAAKAYYLGLCLHETAEDLKTLHHSAYMQLMLGKVEGDWRNSPEALRQAVFSLFAGGFQITAWLQLKAATDFVEVASHLEGKPLSKRPDLLRVAEFYRRGAEANLEIVDKLTLAPNCQKNEIPFDVGRRVFVVGDVYYGVANVGLTRVLPKLPQLLGEGEQLDYAVLAAALTSHTVSAGLVARHYSIGVELGDDFVIKKVKREQALEDWIDLSRRQTEASIGALIAQGVDATTCQASYWAARAAEQKQKPYERFEALQSYFATNLTAQILAELARADASPETAPRFDAPSTPSVPPPAAPVDNALPPPPAPTDDAPAPPAAPRPQIAPPLGVN
ncbi:MAG: hypothetical protein KDA75_15825 [Planctomycetaceae bacterium]|nr:hypothetical protein [Planctomycetaceae bacterium]